jgi:sialate O-acetylesterase
MLLLLAYALPAVFVAQHCSTGHGRDEHAGAATKRTSSGSTPSLAFATTLGDEMVLQASPAQSIVWGPLGDQATAVSVSWEATGKTLPKWHQVGMDPGIAGAVKAKTQDWLGLKIWTAKLPTIAASFTTYTITAKPDVGPSASIANVTFGEVWLCSGQSNMGYTVALDTHCFNKTRNTDGTPNCSKEVYGTCGGRACVWNAGEEVEDMRNYPHIRLMDVQTPPSPNNRPFFSPVPQANSLGWHRPDQYAGECRGNHSDCRLDAWGVNHCGCTNYSSATGCCSRDGTGIWRQDEQTFSAACWFFARDLYASLDPPRPVGVMNNAVGGTADQLWSPPDALDRCKATKAGQPPWGWPANYSSSHLWNALVVPLSRHVIRGVVWYQVQPTPWSVLLQYYRTTPMTHALLLLRYASC